MERPRFSVLGVSFSLAPVSFRTAGGAEQVLALIDRGLVEAGCDSLVVAPEGSEVSGTLLATPPVPESIDDSARDRALEAHRAAIREALRTRPVDLVHLHGVDFNDYRPPNVLSLVTLHLPPGWYAPGSFSASSDVLYACVSESQRKACPAGVPIAAVIENGVDVNTFRPAGAKSDYAVSLGRICPEKGFHIAAAAAERAGIALVLAGQVFGYETHRQYFETEIRSRLNGRFTFSGPVGVEEKRKLLAGARCLLAPSLAPETGSLVAMESLACGTPVIAFPSGALADIVEHGRTGFLVTDEIEMAEAIARCDTLDPAECRRVAVERYSSTRMVDSYFALYRSILSSPQSRLTRSRRRRRLPQPPPSRLSPPSR